MNCFQILGVNESASKEEITHAFREQLAALGIPPDDDKLRELLEARDEALNFTTSVLPVPTSNPLQTENEHHRALIQYQESETSFDRSKKALVSRRITPLARLKTLATILSILSGALAAISYEKFNPFLEEFFQSEIELKHQVVHETARRALERLELGLKVTNENYEQVKSLLDGLSDSQRFETISQLAIVSNRAYLVFGNARVDQNAQAIHFQDFYWAVCKAGRKPESRSPDPATQNTYRFCMEYMDAARDGEPVILSGSIVEILLGVRPDELVDLEHVFVQDLPSVLRSSEEAFVRKFAFIRSVRDATQNLLTFFKINRELAYLNWLYSISRAWEEPVDTARNKRRRFAILLCRTSAGISGLFALVVPLLFFLISRRNRQIEWLVENLEDRYFIYCMIGSVFGARKPGENWLSSDGAGMVEEWMKTGFLANEMILGGWESVRSVVRSNFDAVSFHRLLVAGAMKCGILEQRIEHHDDGISVRYIISVS